MKMVKYAILALAFSVCAVVGASAQSEYSQEELAYMSATELIELFKAGVVAPSDVLEAQIARVKEFNGEYNTSRRDLIDELDSFNAGKVNALTFDNFDEARRLAKEADERYRNGSARRLEGVTVGVKNDLSVKGWRMDMGSLMMKDAPLCEKDETVVERLREQGAILVFQTTVPEMYVSCMTWSRLYGVTRNPWNLYYGVGGSSGGSGAALAAGFCTLATGSDMAGSIRLPASMNGLYGFKPPFGRVPTSNNSYETYGPLARDLADLALMQDAIAGPSPRVYASSCPKLDYPTEYPSLAGEKIAAAYFKDWAPGGNDLEVDRAMDEAIAALKRAGATVELVELDIPRAEFIKAFLGGIMSSETYAMFESSKDFHEKCAYVDSFFAGAEDLTPMDNVRAAKALSRLHKETQQKVFEKGFVAMIMPTLATPYCPADLEATPEKKADANGRALSSFEACMTPLWNLASRYPVLDAPVRLSAKKVPIGVQIVADTYDDLSAFRVAAALSKELPRLYVGDRLPDFRNER